MLNSLSIWRVPASSFKLTKIRIDEAYIHKNTDKELHIACLYNIPSYRCGIIGYLFNFLFYRIPNTYVMSYYFESLRWITDTQIICRSISYINRFIPFLNIMTWNSKKNFINFNKDNSIFHYGGDNDESMSSIFNSFYKPFFDSGCAILSNTPPTTKHFIPFTHHSNKGILYAFYENFNVLVLTIATDQATIEQIQAILSTLHTFFSQQYPAATVYIIGDFKTEIVANQDIMNLISPLFNIQPIDDGLSKTTYLLHNFTFDYKQVDKILKPNTILSSPTPPLTKQNRIGETIETTMEEEKRLHIIEEEHTSSLPTPTTTPPPPSSPVSSPESEPNKFPYIIFNYFSSSSSNKTPPSSSPLSQTPNESPKSDGSWSKV